MILFITFFVFCTFRGKIEEYRRESKENPKEMKETGRERKRNLSHNDS